MSEIIELITKWESFKEQFNEGTIVEFGDWLTTCKKLKTNPVKANSFNTNDPGFNKFSEEQATIMKAGYLISKLYQYLTIYSKPVIKKYGLHSMDDFGFLATVDWKQTISKSKACAAMLQEVTTGSDIIKRLIRLALLKEIPDKADRRQKFLQLTAKGKKVLVSIQADLQNLPDILGKLEHENRVELVGWMAELDQHHEQIVKGKK